MSDNLEFGRIGQNLAIAAVNAVDTAFSRIDARFSHYVTVDVGGDNAHTLAQDDIKNVGWILVSGTGSPQPSGDVTITITPTDLDASPNVARDHGVYGVRNDTAQDVTFTISGQTLPAPVVGANSTSFILVSSTDVTGGSLRAADVTFNDTDGSSPNFMNLQDLGAYLLANVGGGGGGGGGSVSVEDDGSQIVATATTVNFSKGFAVTDGGGGQADVVQDVAIPISSVDDTTLVATGTGVGTFRMPFAMTLTDVRASLKTAAGSGTVTIDINEGGSSVLSTKLTIDAGEKTSETAAAPAVISDSALADDAEITIDIDATDSGSPQTAAGLVVWLIGTYA